jgi:DNA-binding GntR family transcriptional regulator
VPIVFSTNVSFVTEEKAVSLIEKHIPLESVLDMTNENFVEKCFDTLFRIYSTDIIHSRHDIILDDDMPDLEDDAYCDLHSSYTTDIQNSLKNLV